MSATSAPLTAIIDDLPRGVAAVTLPTPFPVGAVNCYLLLDDPLTIVDPGMVWADSTARLIDGLRAEGRRLDEVVQILVTHGHPDHFGAAGWVAEQSGADVLCGRGDAAKLLGRASAQVTDLPTRLGIPEDLRVGFTSFYEHVALLSHPIPDGRVRLLDDGDELVGGGRTWQVHVTPGHSVGHVSLFDPTDRTLLSGDHLLACITPNPVLEPDVDAVDGRRRSLIEYLFSLERFVRLDPLRVLPGHGPRFRDVPTLTEATRRHHERRAEEVLDAVRALGEPTPYELAMSLFPHLEDFTIMLGVSEAVGHLDLLEADGRACRISEYPQRDAVA